MDDNDAPPDHAAADGVLAAGRSEGSADEAVCEGGRVGVENGLEEMRLQSCGQPLEVLDELGPSQVLTRQGVQDRACRGSPSRSARSCDTAAMADAAPRGPGVVLETDRLLLRPWRVAEAAVQRELWSERDPRVPPHRRIDAEGHPTVAELAEAIRTHDPSSIGLLAVERKAAGDVIGYCGLIESERGAAGEPELAFELLRRVWRQGYATEASWAVLDWARSSGHERVWATVWDWNTASRRVLAKIGFVETDRTGVDPVRGTTLFTVCRL